MLSNVGNSRKNNDNNLIIKPYELKKKMDDGDDFMILDVRTKQEHDMWSISYDKYRDSMLIPIDTLMSMESLKKLPKDKEIITYCAHGQRSSFAAMALSSMGYKVRTVEGGISEWSNIYDVTELEIEKTIPLRIWQIRRISKGCMSYVIASTEEKNAVVLDPTCSIDSVIDDLITNHQLKILNIIDTHMHADHLSGATKIALKYKAQLNISSVEKYVLEDLPAENHLVINRLNEGDKIRIGNGFYLEAIHSPGHTEGSMSFTLDLYNTTEGDNHKLDTTNNFRNHSLLIFTGDTIFVNGVGRPDLHNKAQEFTSNLYQTYSNKLFSLPDDTIVLPSHYSETFEHDKPIFNTLRSIKLKLGNITQSENSFSKYVLANIPLQPMNYDKIVKINKNLISCENVLFRDLEAGPNSCGIRT
ncbi:MBL fold metallo-hydrolase [Candidatus Nitrosocosmicus franklandus]|uniref:Putative polyketide biosynthesis zinc-dependent hydrolase BaeB n=1 Tax=Candidatus Nitrosocosmicus franklandianus TaxID=1798806 RepID=A0A484IH38_9ARCH|nr:rhodanese-like domain-containing protein [Candidatus Nitrosocosmicus franklandus]VFJ14974.1 putative polyketide biosynthesis zinc-dependent hydrolase BaeB [Candidatus Nitrosocosmicus franklandus]